MQDKVSEWLRICGGPFEIADFLAWAEIEPTRGAFRSAGHWLRDAGCASRRAPAREDGFRPTLWELPTERLTRHVSAPDGDDGRAGQRYEQSPETGDYRFWVTGHPSAIVLSADQVREILWQYSSAGEGLTQSQVARAHGMTRRTLNGILKALGFVKDDLPYTDEEAADRDPDDLAEELAARMRARIDSKANRLKWRALEQDAGRWRQFELTIGQYVEPAARHIADRLGAVRQREIRRAPAPFALLVPVTDLHVGKGSWSGYGPGAFSIPECKRRLEAAVDSVLSWLPGAPERIILPIGGDFFQSDSITGTTARGTPQDHDGTPERMIVEGFAVAFGLVRELASVAPVTLVFNRGNHDPSLGLALFAALEQYAATDERVTVLQDVDKYGPYQALRYGATLLAFAHGDGRSKPHELATLMAQRWPEEWAASRWRECHLGHTHHVRVVEEAGITALTNPSLSGSDRYHSLHWPHESRAQLACHVYDYDRGRIATVYGVTD